MKMSRNNPERRDWCWQLRNAVGFDELSAFLPQYNFSSGADALFPVKITPYYLELILRERDGGPLRRMVFPAAEELEDGGCSADPFGERGVSCIAPGVMQRFPDRILVMTSGGCAVNCRHCTRRALLGSAVIVDSEQIGSVVDLVKSRPLVREVLLSGGDPLVLPDETIAAFVSAFSGLDQIDAVRVCTRTPVTLPMRFTSDLVAMLASGGKVWVNTQFNHASEITAESAEACRMLVESGVPVSNQSVLLRGVNDSVEAMFSLCSALQRIRVRPYYVFLCDPVAGIEHLRVERETAVRIEQELAERIGGLALPRFVADIPGSARKQPLGVR